MYVHMYMQMYMHMYICMYISGNLLSSPKKISSNQLGILFTNFVGKTITFTKLFAKVRVNFHNCHAVHYVSF